VKLDSEADKTVMASPFLTIWSSWH